MQKMHVPAIFFKGPGWQLGGNCPSCPPVAPALGQIFGMLRKIDGATKLLSQIFNILKMKIYDNLDKMFMKIFPKILS